MIWSLKLPYWFYHRFSSHSLHKKNIYFAFLLLTLEEVNHQYRREAVPLSTSHWVGIIFEGASFSLFFVECEYSTRAISILKMNKDYGLTMQIRELEKSGKLWLSSLPNNKLEPKGFSTNSCHLSKTDGFHYNEKN